MTAEQANSLQADFAGINEEIEKILDNEALLTKAWSSVKTTTDQAWNKFLGDSYKTVGDAVVLGIKGGLDKAEPIWDKAWEILCGSAEKALGNLVSTSGSKLLDSLAGLLSDNVLKPLGQSLGFTGGMDGVFSSIGSGLGAVGGKIGSWLGLAGGGGGALASGEMFADSAAIWDFGSLAGGGAESSLGLSGLGLSPALLGVGGALGVGELMASLTGGVGPVGAAMSLFSGGGGHTQQSALANVNADMDYLRRATELVSQALEQASGNAEGFAATIMEDMSQASLEVERLADRAGLSDEKIDAMVDSMDPMSAKLVEASQALGSANESIDAMSDVLNHSADCFFGATSATDAFDQMIRNLADSLHLPAEQATGLGAATQGLIAQFQAGDISAATLGERLKQAFAQALQTTARDATTTVGQMRALEESIRSIPTEWTSHVNVVYSTTSQQPTYHFGGRVMHSGGWLGDMPRFHAGAQVTGLAADEVPIIARRGEYVVRAESVTAATLPLLSALNQTGQTARAATAQPVNLHVEVHGNILGGEEGMEDLARVMERKLRQIGAGRHGA